MSYDRNLTRHFSNWLESSSADSATLGKLISEPVVRNTGIIRAQKCGNSDVFLIFFPWENEIFFFSFSFTLKQG